MYQGNTLKPFIADEQNIIKQMYATQFEQF